jgi:hypothetical protein
MGKQKASREAVSLSSPKGSRVTTSREASQRLVARGWTVLGVVVGDEPETDDEDSAGADATDPEFPSEEWTAAQIDDWAEREGVSLAGARSKSAKLAAITTALAELDPDAEPEDEDDAEAESASTSTDW